jgi:uncharacterized membrane protein
MQTKNKKPMTAPTIDSTDAPGFRAPEFLVLGPVFAGLIFFTVRQYTLLTVALAVASMLMFVACLWAAQQLLGRRSAGLFAALALALGWFAEQMGSSRGWFFGRYSYTDVLGIQLGNVPVVIPIMWFALCFVAYVMASLLLWRQPVHASPSWGSALLTAWLAAMIVTAFDLGADPYFVFVLKAWIMDKTDGGWFGETLQGFVGWMLIACAIISVFQWWAAPKARVQVNARNQRAALIPLGIYGSGLVFQMVYGHPIEIRAIAFFVMGIPLLVAAAAWWQWKTDDAGASR